MRRIEGKILKKYRPRAYDISTYRYDKNTRCVSITTVAISGKRASFGISYEFFREEPTDFIGSHSGIDRFRAWSTLDSDGGYWSSNYTEQFRPFLAEVLATFPLVPAGYDGWFTAY